MTQPSESGPLAVSHRRIDHRGSWATPTPVEFNNADSVPKTGHRVLGATDLMERPVKPAELAQARLFEGILQTEFARLNELADRKAGPLDWLKHPDSWVGQVPKDRMQVYARLDEVRHLLEALRDRFADARFSGERQTSKCDNTSE